MKKMVALLFVCIYAIGFSQTNISPQFSELKGMEDQLGNTHLFYRIYESYENYPIYWSRNNIYHFDLDNGIDTFFLSTGSSSDPIFNYAYWVNDYKFWNNNPAEFIFSGGYSMGPYFEGSAFVERFDGYYNTIDYFWGSADYIDISPSNDSMLYLGVNAYGGLQTLLSSDGGRSWDSLSIVYQFLSLNPYYENIYFVENENRELLRTTDSGNTFNLVDPEFLVDTRFHYDPNGQHIYRKANNKLIVSDNLGEQFSWETVFTKTTTDPFYFNNDISLSGSIFISEGKNIFYSLDYGNNFTPYKSLERKIFGIYKKPNSNKLYAASKYKIYEITPDTIQEIKSLNIPEEVLSFYPLAVGNKWVFHHSTVTYDPYPNYSYQIDVKEVLGDTIAPNGKYYYKVNDETIWEPAVLERIDSTNGKVYRYYEDPTLPDDEYVAYDLVAEVGDTIFSYRMGFNTVMFTTMYAETTFEKWGLIKPKKVFEEYTLHPPIFSITQEFGLDSIYSYFDFGETYITLKGCIIDGVVYGDTTTVDVEDEKTPSAVSFKLEQNYPNPFNPSTKIKFSIPSVQTRDRVSVLLKVYDVLGNEIATLVNEEKPAGEYEVIFDATELPSGIYFYQLRVGGPETSSGQKNIQTKKMVLLK